MLGCCLVAPDMSCYPLAVDDLRRDDIASARKASPAEKLAQALELMAYGLEIKRQNLRRAMPSASDGELQKAFEDWLFERG